MKTRYSIALIALVGLALALPASATSPSTTAQHFAAEREFTLPEHAVEVTPNVFSLGAAIDPTSGREVEGYAIVHPRENAHHRSGHGGGPDGNNGGGKNKGGDACFTELAKGAVWKTPEMWLLNPANTRGLDEGQVFTTFDSAIDEWEDATNGDVDDGIATGDIFDTGFATSSVLVANTESPDGINEVYFGSIDDAGAIAVTITWGIFSGPPPARELVEWDQIYDEVDYNWSFSGATNTMDFENIAQHELGHALGLGHPSDTCTEETMYRFATEGETKKRDLNAGDIAGADKLY